MHNFTIAIDRGQGPKRVAKFLVYADGGFGLVPLFPLSPNSVTLLMESQTLYGAPGFVAGSNAMWKEFHSAHPIKLSIHGGGFVQFSAAASNGIVSGTDPVTHRPRGFGYQGRQPHDPTRSGPTIGLTAWGLDAYKDCPRGGARTIVVEAADIYETRIDPGDQIGYASEFWPLPRPALALAHSRGGLPRLATRGHPYYGGDVPFEWTILDIENPLVIIGLVVTRYATTWQAPSGMSLSGPSDLAMERVLLALAPAPDKKGIGSADFIDVGKEGIGPGRSTVDPVRRLADDDESVRKLVWRAGRLRRGLTFSRRSLKTTSKGRPPSIGFDVSGQDQLVFDQHGFCSP